MRLSHSLALTASLLIGGLVFADPADWPNFRGPNHDGISPETGFKKEWDKPIPLVWERELGSGFSSFAIVGDKLYTCGTRSRQQTVFCLNAATGEVVWQKPLEQAYPEPQGGDGPRATPTVHDGRVYVLGAFGKFVCLDAKTGEEIWTQKFRFRPQWGYSGSVLVEGNLAIASGGDKDGALVAYDRKTGKEVWKCGEDPVGYATPYPFTFNGKRYVVGFTGNAALIAELETGRQVGRMEWITDWKVNAAAPIFHEGHLFFSSGYRHGATLMKLQSKGDELAATPVWENKVIRNKFQSSVLHEGHLYTSDENSLKCVEFMTGKEKWKVNRIKDSTLLIADGHILLLTEDGELQIAKASPAEYKPLTKAAVLSDRCWAVPVLHEGRLYVRNLERMKCFNLKE